MKKITAEEIVHDYFNTSHKWGLQKLGLFLWLTPEWQSEKDHPIRVKNAYYPSLQDLERGGLILAKDVMEPKTAKWKLTKKGERWQKILIAAGWHLIAD